MEACALAMKAGVEAAVMVTLMVALFAMATEVRAVAGGASLISVPVRAGACQDTVATSAMLRLTCATFAMVIVARAAAVCSVSHVSLYNPICSSKICMLSMCCLQLCMLDMGVRTMIQLNSTTLTPQYAFRCVCDNGYCGGSCDQVCGNAFHRGEGEEQEAHSLEEASSSSNGGNNTLPDNTITIVLALVGCVVAGAIIAVVSACFVRKRKVQKARSYRRQRDIRGRHSVESIGYGENTFGDSEVLSPAEVVPVTPVQLQALRHDRGIPIVKGEAVPPPK
mmetsp:Transcript_15269/g.38561  ORF Transcript_15269/g.38561 Transcript_15269/m.38561 type:complete len:280 (-) Transcript_15269:952-1791(-)